MVHKRTEMEKESWQALPPRKKGRRAEKSDSGKVLDSSVQQQTNSAKERQDLVLENVQKRINRSEKGEWAEATLESKDGHAGEFYEYLDHTADVQCHAWGSSLIRALENMSDCMFGYMTDITLVEVDDSINAPLGYYELQVKGHDMHSLLFAYMDELLYKFCTDGFVIKRVSITELKRNEVDFKSIKELSTTDTTGTVNDKDGNVQGAYMMSFRIYGCEFDRSKHVQGTEIKAITYSNMQLLEEIDKVDLYVIVDI